jgi:hypothetical protein
VSFDYCPVGRRRGDTFVRFGISAFNSVSGYGVAFCEADPSYP